jgi:hypothetical protein
LFVLGVIEALEENKRLHDSNVRFEFNEKSSSV